MNDFLKLIVLCGALVGCYYKGYVDGATNKLVISASKFVENTASGVQKLETGVETIKSFPAKFGAKMDEIYDKVKNLFRWKRGSDGKIYLDPDSPAYDDVDRELRSSDAATSGATRAP